MEGAKILELERFWIFEKRTVANDVQSGGFGDARSRVCWIKIELIAAIGAQMAITAKQFAVIKRRDLVEPLNRHCLVLDANQ